MDMKTVTANFSVADQVTEADLITLKAAGFNTLICNRPDNEAPEQPNAACLAERARSLGLTWHWLPITPGQFSDDSIAEFKHILSAGEAPVLAFCRTGTRSISLWALSQASKTPTAELLQQARAAGYDLSTLAPLLDAGKS